VLQIKNPPQKICRRFQKKRPQAGNLEHNNRPPFSPYQPHRTGLKAVIIIFFLRMAVKLSHRLIPIDIGGGNRMKILQKLLSAE